jgi:hypothetical protein
MKIFLLLFVILLILLIYFHSKYENYSNKVIPLVDDYNHFVNNLSKFQGKKKYVLLFTSGPTLAEFKKSDISKKIWDDCYIIAVKNSINYLDKINIKVDFLITNFTASATRINIDLLDKHKSINIGLDFGKIPKLRQKFHHLANFNTKKNHMQLVKDDKKNIEFENINGKLYTGNGHIMMEMAIPFSIFLEPKNIITIGWDQKNNTFRYGNKIHWDTINHSIKKKKKETFIDWGDEYNIINEFSVHLHNYLKKHYNIKIYKINKKSSMKLPIFNKSL